MKPGKITDKCRFKNLVFIFPDLKYGKPILGVYKIWFDETYFYIGSSNNVKIRMRAWEYVIHRGGTHNSNMENILPNVKNIRFEIVAIDEDYRNIEDALIKEKCEDMYLLNHSPTAFSLKGYQKVKGGKQKSVRVNKAISPLYSQRVAQLSMNGEIVKKYNSVSEAVRAGFNVIPVLTKKMIKSGGFKFRLMDENGNIIDFDRKPNYKISASPYFKKSKWVDDLSIKPNIIFRGTPGVKIPIISINKNGEIQKYASIKEAGRVLNLLVPRIRLVLQGKRRYYHDYVFRYA